MLPQHYSYQRKIFGIKKREQLTFNWAEGTVVYQSSKQRRQQATVAGLLDPSLYQLQLQRELANNPSATQLSYRFARRQHLKTYVFERQGMSQVMLAGQAHQAVLFARIEQDKSTHIWLVPTLDFAIAQIKHQADGDATVQLVDYKSSSSLKEFLKTN